jgi:hypothetical protein
MGEFGRQITYGNARAENDLSSCQYCIVELSGANLVDIADATTDVKFGVLQNKPQALEAATVSISGITKCRAGATISAADEVTSTASGNATGVTSGINPIGQAITAAASGGFFTMRQYNMGGLTLA